MNTEFAYHLEYGIYYDCPAHDRSVEGHHADFHGFTDIIEFMRRNFREYEPLVITPVNSMCQAFTTKTFYIRHSVDYIRIDFDDSTSKLVFGPWYIKLDAQSTSADAFIYDCTNSVMNPEMLKFTDTEMVLSPRVFIENTVTDLAITHELDRLIAFHAVFNNDRTKRYVFGNMYLSLSEVETYIRKLSAATSWRPVSSEQH